MYPCPNRCSLNRSSLLFLNTHFESIRNLFGGIILLLGFLHTPLFIISLNSLRINVHQPSHDSEYLGFHASWRFCGLMCAYISRKLCRYPCIGILRRGIFHIFLKFLVLIVCSFGKILSEYCHRSSQ